MSNAASTIEQQPTAAGQTLSREAVLTLVRDEPSSPLALTVAVQGLAQCPDDQLLRLLFAARLAKAGLRTLAGEQLDQIPAQGPLEQQLHAMRCAIAALPDDRIEPAIVIAAANTAAMELAGLGILDAQTLAAFEHHANARRWMLMLDGSLVSHHDGELNGLTKCLDQSQDACTKIVDVSREYTRPVVVCGQSVALTAHLALKATSKAHLGYTPRVYLVEPDAMSLCESLAELVLINGGTMPASLLESRVEWCIGTDATSTLRARLLELADAVLPDRVVAANSAAGRLCSVVAGILEEAHAAQQNSIQQMHARIEEAYQNIARATWQDRFTQAAAGQLPLRVSIITSRFTTYVQHAARDLAGALERAGHEVNLIIEPDDHSNLSAHGYLRAFDVHRPDLVIAINYPRATLGAACPSNVPFVCWVQDALSHLFQSHLGRASGPMDFLLGNLFNELFEKFGFPSQRALSSPVVADAVKFHPAPAATIGAYRCDLAIVSHHSETPDAMHARLVGSARTSAPALVPVFEAIRPIIGDVVRSCASRPANSMLRSACISALSAAAAHRDERAINVVLRGYALPMADRLLRHTMLDHARVICERHDLSLHVYGKGWGTHPTLAAYAKGPLDHGEQLRAAYQGASMHLHISINTLMHQRLLECFLSGGLCLCMDHRESLAHIKTLAQLELIRTEGDRSDPDRGLIGYSCSVFPAAAALASQLAAAGQPLEEPVVWIRPDRIAAMRRMRSVLEQQVAMDSILSSPGDILFHDAASLEERVLAYAARPARRQAIIEEARSRILSQFTHDALSSRLLRFIAHTLTAPTESAS
jgi:hypothetical protein